MQVLEGQHQFFITDCRDVSEIARMLGEILNLLHVISRVQCKD